MSPEQFDRWKDFAIRMARHAFPNATSTRRAKIEKSVGNFFSWRERNDEDTAAIVDWDNSPTYIGDAVSSHLNEHYHEREIP